MRMEVAYAIVDAVRSLGAGCEGNDGFSFRVTFPRRCDLALRLGSLEHLGRMCRRPRSRGAAGV